MSGDLSLNVSYFPHVRLAFRCDLLGSVNPSLGVDLRHTGETRDIEVATESSVDRLLLENLKLFMTSDGVHRKPGGDLSPTQGLRTDGEKF